MSRFDRLIKSMDAGINNVAALEERFRKHTISRAMGVGKIKETYINIMSLVKDVQVWQKEQQKTVAELNGIDVTKDTWEQELRKIQENIVRVQQKIGAGVATADDIANMPILKQGDMLNVAASLQQFLFDEKWEDIQAIIAGALGVDVEYVEDIPVSCVFDFIVMDKAVHAFLPRAWKQALNEHFYMLQNHTVSPGTPTPPTLNRAERRSLTGSSAKGKK